MGPFLKDFREAMRSLWRGNHLMLSAIAILCVGVGSATALFSVLNGVLLRPLPFPQSERLVHVGFYYPKGAMRVFEERSQSFTSIAAYLQTQEMNLTGAAEPVRLKGSTVSAQFFNVLGVQAAKGRTFVEGDDKPGAETIVLLSHSLWTTRFDSDPSIIGRKITVDGQPRTVVGIMPASFRFPLPDGDLWIPSIFDPRQVGELWGNFGYQLVGRLKPDASLGAANAEVRALAPAIRDAFPWKMPAEWGSSPDYRATSLRDWITDRARDRVLLLFAAVLILFLIACANVANLLLARASSRSAELALRCALGATRWDLIRHLLAESAAIALAGGALGLGLAVFLVHFLKRYLPAETPRIAEVEFDGTVLLFGFALAVFTTLLCGTIPAWRGAQFGLANSLKLEDRRVQGGRGKLREALVVVEVALALVLFTAAGLVVRSLQAALETEKGFRPEQIATAKLTPQDSNCKPMARCAQNYESIVESVRGFPGVIAASAVSDLPMSGEGGSIAIDLEDHPRPPGAYAESATRHAVLPGYFNVMGIRFLDGRDIARSDGEDSELVVVVNKKLADRFWPGKSALGKHIKYVWENKWRTIVGVVGDVRQDGYSRPVPFEFAVPVTQSDTRAMVVTARLSGDAAPFFKMLPATVATVDPTMPVSKLRAMSAVVEESTSNPRFLVRMASYFAFLALILSAMGIYGVMVFSVRKRTSEVGVRLALGCSHGAAFRMVFLRGLSIGLAGVLIGIPFAILMAKAMKPILFGVSPIDPVSLGFGCLFMIVVTAISVAIPSRRILALDPVAAMRNEQ
jgi:predicted permease